MIPTACTDKDAAWEFLDWMTSPKPVRQFCEAIHNLPPLLSVGRDAYFQNDPLYRFCIPISEGANAFGPPPIPIWPTYAREIGRVEEKVTLGGDDPRQALAGLQSAMAKELREAREDLAT